MDRDFQCCAWLLILLLPQEPIWTLPSRLAPAVFSDPSTSLFSCAAFSWCCYLLGLPYLLQLQSSGPSQLPLCLVSWPAASCLSTTQNPTGPCPRCFQQTLVVSPIETWRLRVFKPHYPSNLGLPLICGPSLHHTMWCSYVLDSLQGTLVQLAA